MEMLFAEADDSGDGFLSEDEFRAVIEDVRVKAWLQAMELDIRDAELVFALVDDGDHRISAAELVHGFSRLKGTARSLDMVTLMSETRRFHRMMQQMCEY